VAAMTRAPIALLPWLLACGASTAAPASVSPEAAAEPSSSAPEEAVAEAPSAEEPTEPTWVWEPNDYRTKVVAGRSGPVVGYLRTPELLATAERRGSSLSIATPFRRDDRQTLSISVWGDNVEPFEAPETDAPIRVATHHRVLLHIDDGAPIELGCDTIEVLEDGEGRTWARVARRGLVLEGWIEGRVEGRGPATCPARGFEGAVEALPEGYVAVDPPRSLPRRGSVWWLAGTADARACQRWDWARGGRRLESRSEDGVASYEVQRSGSRLTLAGPGFEGSDGSSMGMGCMQVLGAVGADEARLVFVADLPAGATGYHPDDAQVWYRSEAACEAAREAEALSRQGC